MTAPPLASSPGAKPPGPAARTRQLLRDSPLTVAAAVVSTLFFGAQLAVPAVAGTLQRDAGIVGEGQWWRVLTALLVQPSGWGQFAYNTLGLVLVGVVVERWCGRIRWLAVGLAAGLAGAVVTVVLDPSGSGGGSSDVVAGLIGALAVTAWRTGRPPPLPALLYAGHFAVYLTFLAAAGAVAATVAGTVAIALAAAAHRAGRARPPVLGLLAVVVCGAGVMTVLGDDHGIGLLAGLVLALVWGLPAGRMAAVGGGQGAREPRRRS